jgi:hypothetical protein
VEERERITQSQGGQAVKRYKIERLKVSGPIYGFLIHTPRGKTMRDIYPNTIAKELNRLNNRIKRLEEGGGLALGYASKGDFESADEVWRKAKEAKP